MIEEKIIEKVREYVEEECKKSTSKYGYEPYEFHFVPMVNYAKILAEKTNANLEIVEIAGWLHDIGSIIYGRENHHITGSEIAEEKLMEFGYPEDKIEKVKKCILNHRGSVKNKLGSIEEQIIVEADAMSNFENVSGIFKAAFIYEELDQGEAAKAVYCKLKGKWEQLKSDYAKDLIRDKFEAVKVLFRGKNGTN